MAKLSPLIITIFYRCRIVVFLLFTTILACAQSRSGLIDRDVAIFIPANFEPEAHLPSMALIKEPEMNAVLPVNWQTVVTFERALNKHMAYIEVDAETDLYGTGEVTGDLIRNGTSIGLWNTDNFTYKKAHGRRLYQTHPWVLGVRKDGSAFGVLSDNTWKQELTLGDGILFTSEGPAFRVIVIEKDSPQEVLRELGRLTGTISLPPLWSLGYQQCRWSYYPDSRVREIADTMRLKRIPCDVIWMDIHYMDGYRIFTFDSDRFPNPNATNQYLHDKDFKSIWMIDPGVKAEEGYWVYDEGTAIDAWVKNADGENYIGEVWPGDCVFPDYTMPEVRNWWSGLYRDFMATGIDGVWNDMNEPAVFNLGAGTMPADNIHRGGGGQPEGPHLRYRNIYGLQMVKASRDGILAANPSKRPFVLTRSNYIGGQRYAATWTGDNISNWEHLKMSIPMSLNLGLSGQPFNGPDIGGFAGNATPELFGHWIALGAFYPFSRGHTVRGSRPHEPWAFGEKIEAVSRTAMERRYKLLPYLYTLFKESSELGMPIMRPVFFADNEDPALRREQEIFLLGDDLLVIPLWAENPALPKGAWRSISLFEDERENDAYQPEIRLKPGSILPVSSVIQSTEDYNLDTLQLFINLDKANTATGRLYYDAGDGYEYKQGAFADMTIRASAEEDSLVIRTAIEGQLDAGIEIVEIVWYSDAGVKRKWLEFSKIMTF